MTAGIHKFINMGGCKCEQALKREDYLTLLKTELSFQKNDIWHG